MPDAVLVGNSDPTLRAIARQAVRCLRAAVQPGGEAEEAQRIAAGALDGIVAH